MEQRITPRELSKRIDDIGADRVRDRHSLLFLANFAWAPLFLIGGQGMDPMWGGVEFAGAFVFSNLFLLLYFHRRAEGRREVIESLVANHRYEEAVAQLLDWYWTTEIGPTLYSNGAVCGVLLAWAAERKAAGDWEDVLAIAGAARRLPGGGIPLERLLLEEAEAYEATGRRGEALSRLILLRGETVPSRIRERAESMMRKIA